MITIIVILLDRLDTIGRMVGEEPDYTQAKQKFEALHGRSPNAEDAEMIRMFNGPNAAQRDAS